jgi:hypothetical protein
MIRQGIFQGVYTNQTSVRPYSLQTMHGLLTCNVLFCLLCNSVLFVVLCSLFLLMFIVLVTLFTVLVTVHCSSIVLP